MKHTDGPWAWRTFGEHVCLVGEYGHRPIILDAIRKGMNGATLRVRVDGLMTTFDPQHPDARLIAACPDMYEALEEIAGCGGTQISLVTKQKIAALLAKAKGVEKKDDGWAEAWHGLTGE